MIAEECISECIKRQDRLYQIVQENIAQVQKKIRKRKLDQGEAVVMQVGDRVLRQNKRSQQRKGGKLDPDFLGPYTVTKVDGKSVDIVDDHGKLFPRVNIDHLVHFLEDHPPKAPKVTSTITTTTFPTTTFSVPHTTQAAASSAVPSTDCMYPPFKTYSM